MSTIKTIEALDRLMMDFGLEQASLTNGDVRIEFDRRVKGSPEPITTQSVLPAAPRIAVKKASKKSSVVSLGTPVQSPTTGIFYTSANPGSPPFVSIGDTVVAGQVIGLIEAMKVFNEITSTISGTVKATPAANGQLVQPGDPLIIVG